MDNMSCIISLAHKKNPSVREVTVPPQEHKLIPYVHMGGVSQVSTVTNVSASGTDGGMECAPSEFPAHTSLGGAVNTLEERNTSQGDLGTLELLASANLMEFSKVQDPTPEPHQSHTYRLGEVIESSPTEKDLVVMAGEKCSMSQLSALLAQKANHVLGFSKRGSGQQIKGRYSLPLLL